MIIVLMIKVILLVLALGLVQSQQDFTRVLHSYDRGARCLDGTPVSLYYHEGKGENKNKFIIYFDSGGFCEGRTIQQTLESCYRRSNGSLGSSKNDPPFKNMDKLGLLSTLQSMNPVFYDWTKVWVKYCDGSQYTGSRVEPISYKDKKLYFRGYNNTMEQFYFLDKQFDFYNADTIVLTGVSAGGIGTYLYSNYLVQNAKKAKVYAIPDSGLFITQYFSPIAGLQIIKLYAQNLFQLIHEEEVAFPFPQCIEENKDSLYLCYNAANLAKYLKAPMLIVESPYDEYSANVIIEVNCLTNKAPPYDIATCNETAKEAIEDYRNQTIEAIYQIKGNRKDVGVWAPSCVQHGFTDMSSFADPLYKIPSTTGAMVSQAIRQFLANPNEAPWYLDSVPWPYNYGCNGQNKLNLQMQ